MNTAIASAHKPAGKPIDNPTNRSANQPTNKPISGPTNERTSATKISRTQTALVFISLLCAGYLTGLFTAWSAAVMPGLGTTDDQTFVAAIQGLETRFDGGDSAIPDASGNWPTFIAFFTGPLWCAAALVIHRRRPAIARLLAGALACLVLGIITTLLFNVPANIAITAAGDPSLASVDANQVRAEFNELSWTRWNHVRAVASAIAFGLLAWAFRLQAAAGSASGQMVQS